MQFRDDIDRDEFNHIMLELDDKLFAMKCDCFAKTNWLHLCAAQLPSDLYRLQDKMQDAICELSDLIERLTDDMRKDLPFLTSEID